MARYQPESVAGQHLSPVVVCDFAQLTPERTATLARPDATHVRVLVTGAVGERDGTIRPGGPGGRDHPDRVVLARVERMDPTIGTGLGWETTAVRTLRVRGRDGMVVTWGDELALPEAVPVRRPGSRSDWRVTGTTVRGRRRGGRPSRGT